MHSRTSFVSLLVAALVVAAAAAPSGSQCTYEPDQATVSCRGGSPDVASQDIMLSYDLRDVDEAAAFLRRSDALDFFERRGNVAVNGGGDNNNGAGSIQASDCNFRRSPSGGGASFNCQSFAPIGPKVGDTVVAGPVANYGRRATVSTDCRILDQSGAWVPCDHAAPSQMAPAPSSSSSSPSTPSIEPGTVVEGPTSSGKPGPRPTQDTPAVGPTVGDTLVKGPVINYARRAGAAPSDVVSAAPQRLAYYGGALAARSTRQPLVAGAELHFDARRATHVAAYHDHRASVHPQADRSWRRDVDARMCAPVGPTKGTTYMQCPQVHYGKRGCSSTPIPPTDGGVVYIGC